MKKFCQKKQQKQANIYSLEVKNRNSRKRCSKLTTKTPEQRQSRCCGVFIVEFEHVSHLSSFSIFDFAHFFLVFLLQTLNK